MSKTYVAVQRTGQNDNELTHWKYIKREKKPNGKYRYYYDVKDMLGYDERDEVKRKAYQVGEARETVNKMRDNFNMLPHNDGSTYGNKTKGEWYNEMEKSERELKKVGREYWDAYDKYTRTPLGQIQLVKEEIIDIKNWMNRKIKDLININ